MFLNQLKDFFTKKLILGQLPDMGLPIVNKDIKTIGVLFDETYNLRAELFVDLLVKQGFVADNISVLIFKDALKKEEAHQFPVFTYQDLSWKATFKKPEVDAFIEKHFDMLISYYDIEKSPLLLTTHLSKADFKVGFAGTNKNLHHFMIGTRAEHYGIFAVELNKYLRILNKIK